MALTLAPKCNGCGKNPCVRDESTGDWLICPECQKKALENNERSRQEFLREHTGDAMLEAGFPKRFLKADLNDFEDSIINTVKLAMKSNLGIMMTGTVGIGKTHLLCAFARELILKNTDVFFINFPEHLAEIKRHMNHPKRSEGEEQALECGHLFIDDVGAENPTDWSYEQLYIIINSRYEKELPVSIAMNRPMEDARICRRLLEMTANIEL